MADTRLRALIESRYDDKGTKAAQKDIKDLSKTGEDASRGTGTLNTSMGSMQGLVAKLVAGGLFIQAGRMLLEFGKNAVQAASDVEEMQSKFNVVFGEEAVQVEKTLTDFGESVNRSRFDLMEMAASIQDTFVPMGFARDQAADLSVQLTQLATDVASFNNAQDVDVMRDFQSALVGNTETVRKYGVVITEANTKAKAYEMGIAEVGKELTEQQKVQARLQLLLDGTSDAHGDAARTADSYANMSRGLDAALQDLTVTIGQGLVPMLKEGKQAGMEFAQAALGPASAWTMLMQAVDAGLITTFEANMMFATMVYTGKDAGNIIEDLTRKFELIDKAAEAATATYEEYVIATTDLAQEKGELSQAEREAILLHYGFIDAAGQQATALANNSEAVQYLHDKIGLLTKGEKEIIQIDLERELLKQAKGHRTAARAADDQAMSEEQLKRAISDLQLFISGPLGKETERYQEQQAELAEQIEEQRKRIQELGGTEYLTPEQAAQIEETQQRLNGVVAEITRVQDLLKGEDLNKRQEKAAKSELEDLQREAYNLERTIENLGGKPYITEEQKKQLEEARKKYAELTGQVEVYEKEHDEATKRILIDLLMQRAAIDGVSEAELTMLNDLALKWGLIDQETYETVQSMDKALGDLAAGESIVEVENQILAIGGAAIESGEEVAELERKARLLGEAALSTAGDYSIHFTITQSGNIPTLRPGQNQREILEDIEDFGPGGQRGLHMIVPPGYPSDTYTLRASSGERVDITPASQLFEMDRGSLFPVPAAAGVSTAGGQMVYQDNRVFQDIDQHNYDEAAVVLGQAIFDVQRNARLDADMAG